MVGTRRKPVPHSEPKDLESQVATNPHHQSTGNNSSSENELAVNPPAPVLKHKPPKLDSSNKVGSLLCPQCPEKFSSQRFLKRHRLVIHSAPDSIFRCDICKRKGNAVGFDRNACLLRHLRNVHYKSTGE